METVTHKAEFKTVVQCPECDISFIMSEHFIKQREMDGKTFWCPNGHSIRWAPSLKEV